jgi:peptidoglycan hydrolase-like protein with peptidoglycan-binding domain
VPSAQRTTRAGKGRADAGVDDDLDLDVADRPAGRRFPRLFALPAWGWSHRDAVGCVVGVSAAVAILVNSLFLQSGPHPAPMVKSSLLQTGSVAAKADRADALPHSRPVATLPAKVEPAAPQRPAVETITDIQRELNRRGFYDGTIDGRYGPKTDAAIRDFEQSAGLKPSTEPNEVLLHVIKGSPGKPKTTGSAGHTAQPVRNDPIGDILGPSKRVLAVQRALAEFGYAQIKPTGILDPETHAAIARFERERKLPITGDVSDRVTRELASITGRPLE